MRSTAAPSRQAGSEWRCEGPAARNSTHRAIPKAGLRCWRALWDSATACEELRRNPCSSVSFSNVTVLCNTRQHPRPHDMTELIRYPQTVFLLSFVVLWLAARIGAAFKGLQESDREIFGVVRSAALTLMGLIIGFSFSMASSRYDQRKNLEQAEASAISTEYSRADYLPAPEAAKVRSLLLRYLDQRLLFYRTRSDHQLEQINATLAQLETDIWATIHGP